MDFVSMVSKPFVKARNAVQNVRRLGLTGAIALYRYRIRETYRDRRLGIQSAGFHDPHELGHGPERCAYEAISYHCLDIVFNHLKPLGGNDVFLDYGCGKGRAVVTAATYAFHRVLGVELSVELSDIARENVRRAAGKLQCPDVEIITADATEYEVPDDVTVMFLFNPFSGNVLAAVQQKIKESLQRAPRRLRVVYLHPNNDPNGFLNCDWLDKQCDLPAGDWDEVRLMVYESQPPPERPQDGAIAAMIES